jgi:protocatechuate 3,4-dioxygenase alpha subunit
MLPCNLCDSSPPAGFDDWRVVPHDTPGKIRLCGILYDQDGRPVADHVIESRQVDSVGRDCADARADASNVVGFRGTGRCVSTSGDGYWEIETVKPGQPELGGTTSAPHIALCVWLRNPALGLITRVYFADEQAANATDVVLQAVPDSLRDSLVAKATSGGYRFDIRLGGSGQTVFFSTAP